MVIENQQYKLTTHFLRKIYICLKSPKVYSLDTEILFLEILHQGNQDRSKYVGIRVGYVRVDTRSQQAWVCIPAHDFLNLGLFMSTTDLVNHILQLWGLNEAMHVECLKKCLMYYKCSINFCYCHCHYY